jgi:thiamine-phosphate pyrophosphorylase
VTRALGRLHVVTDATLQTRLTHAELARLAARGGADTIQFREKRPWTTRALVEAAAAVRRALAGTGAALIVDDRVDVAGAIGVAAVHLGRDDLDVATARRLLGPGALIGGTANSLEEARRVAASGVDYLGVGPVFGTRSKANPAAPLGLDGLRAIVRAVPVPVIAIGSITAERVADVLDAGAHGVAVLSAVARRDDPEAAARELRRAVDRRLGAPAR